MGVLRLYHWVEGVGEVPSTRNLDAAVRGLGAAADGDWAVRYAVFPPRVPVSSGALLFSAAVV